MKKGFGKRNTGITLIALVVSIIIILILAGISINMLLGNNSILQRATQAKEDTIIGQEKEQISLAWNSLILDKTTGKISDINEDNFENELNNSGNNTQVDYVDNDVNNDFLVYFEDTKHIYLVDKNGNITLKDSNYIAKEDNDIENYVKDGLILWYDGIQNTRAGNNPNATSWEDLSGNNNDGVFSSAMVANQNDITATSKGYYDVNEHGYVFWHNDAFIQSNNNLEITGNNNYTFEIIAELYESGKNSNYTVNYAWRSPINYGSGSNNIGLSYYTPTSKISWGYPTNDAYSEQSYNLFNNAFSLIFRKNKQGAIKNGDTDAMNVNLNNANVTCIYNGRTLTPNLGNSPLYVGRGWQYGSDNRTCYGVVKSIRVYNRPLTNDEINQNYSIDNKRYLKNIFNLDKANKKIDIDTSNIQKLMYIFGKENEARKIKNNGQEISISRNNTSLNLTKNGYYSFLIIDKSGNERIRTVQAEGMDLYTTYKINNANLRYKRIVIVGENEECRTVKEAFDYLYDNGYIDNGAILLKEGTHDTQDFHKGTSYNILPKYNGMTVSIIGDKPGSTFMTGGEMMLSENNTSYWAKLNFYRVVFTNPCYTDSATGVLHLGGDSGKNSYYNCVFLPKIGGWNGKYSNAEIGTYNCLFAGGINSWYASKPLSGESINSASIDTNIDPYNGTKTTCITNITVDNDYNITSGEWEHKGTGTNPDGTQANIGVYGGDFSW